VKVPTVRPREPMSIVVVPFAANPLLESTPRLLTPVVVMAELPFGLAVHRVVRVAGGAGRQN